MDEHSKFLLPARHLVFENQNVNQYQYWKPSFKKTNINFTVENKAQYIFLNNEDKKTTYNIQDKTMKGDSNPLSEDLRDYLRRRGIKIYTGGLFKSI